MPEISPIPTAYAGCRFRSRLEARWAVFFDTLEVPWQYEPEGFDLGEGRWYLPDFWLPEQRIWFEVKGHKHADGEELWRHFAHAAFNDIDEETFRLPERWRGRPLLAWGDIPDPRTVGMGGAWHNELMLTWADGFYQWCICPECGELGAEYEGRAGRIDGCDVYERTLTANHPRLLRAYAEARAASFEHDQRERW